MNVPELMPRHPSYSRRRLQHVRQQLGFAQGIALAIPEHEILWRAPIDALAMRRECRDRVWTERNRPHGLLRLGRLELSLEDGLAHRQRSDVEIESAPPQAQQLANSQSRRGDETD